MKYCFLLISLCFASICATAQTPQSMVHYEIGARTEGGIVFYMDVTGKHGLVAMPFDQAKKVPWGANSDCGADSPSDGASNSAKIISYSAKDNPGRKKTAAGYCDTLTNGGYTDWYLPSIMELRRLYQAQDVVGGFTLGDYCSSSEYGHADAYAIHFRPHNRVEFYYNKIDPIYNVRCIRKF
jgi:hypothetical protein